MSTNTATYISPEQYLLQERAAPFKSEYKNGGLVPMSGARERHVLLVTNLVTELGTQLRRGPCRVYSADMRVWIPTKIQYTYPDLAVVCDKPAFLDQVTDTLLNPELIIEVLSPSTEDYDRGGKFASYRTIPSLREYLTVAQNRVEIEHHVRTNGTWVLTEHITQESSIQLLNSKVTLSLADVYDGIDLDPSNN